jgi:hypothetical protein
MTDGKKSTEKREDAASPSPPGDMVKPAPKGAEVGGPKGLEPTRYGDWERDGRCVDF